VIAGIAVLDEPAAILVIDLGVGARGVFVVQDHRVFAAAAQSDREGRIEIEDRGSTVAPDNDKTCAHGDEYSVKGASATTNVVRYLM
jgi:hypothetical protein